MAGWELALSTSMLGLVELIFLVFQLLFYEEGALQNLCYPYWRRKGGSSGVFPWA